MPSIKPDVADARDQKRLAGRRGGRGLVNQKPISR